MLTWIFSELKFLGMYVDVFLLHHLSRFVKLIGPSEKKNEKRVFSGTVLTLTLKVHETWPTTKTLKKYI